jgi:hypothetical protein
MFIEKKGHKQYGLELKTISHKKKIRVSKYTINCMEG